MRMAFKLAWAGFFVLALAACQNTSMVAFDPMDGDNTQEAAPEEDREEAPASDGDRTDSPPPEADVESAEPDTDPEQDDAPAEGDADWAEADGPEPDHDWERGEFDSEPLPPENPTPAYFIAKRLHIPFLKALEAQNNGTGDDHMERWIHDSQGYLLTTQQGRVVAFTEDFTPRWEYALTSDNRMARLIGQDKNQTVYLFRLTTTDDTSYYHAITLLDRASGRVLREYELGSRLGELGLQGLQRFDWYDFSLYVHQNWLFVAGPNYAHPSSGQPGKYWGFVAGLSLPDMTLQWQRESPDQWSFGDVAFAFPDGSYGLRQSSTLTHPLFFDRITPFGESLGSFRYGEERGNEAEFAPLAMSDGTAVAYYAGALWGIGLDGTTRWRNTIGYPCHFQVGADDSVSAVDGGNRIQHYSALGSPLYRSGGFFDALRSVVPLPASSPWPWMAGSSEYVQLHKPYDRPPETYPYEATCQEDFAESTVAGFVTPPSEASSEDWELILPASDSPYSCPAAPSLPSPFTASAYTAYSDATLSEVWVGNADALWHVDLTTRQATCRQIGKVEVLAGMIGADGKPLLAFVMDHLLYSGPATGPFTSQALPAELDAALSLAIDAQQVAIGGASGLWLKTGGAGAWTKIETCCGESPQVGHCGLFFDQGEVVVGARQGIWRVNPATASCRLLCGAFSANSSYEVYGRSARGIWAGRKETRDTRSDLPAFVDYLGECLDNGLWFAQTEFDTYYSAAADRSGLISMTLIIECGPFVPGSGCHIYNRLRSLPTPFGHSSTVNVDGRSTNNPLEAPTNARIVPTATGYFLPSCFVEARRKLAGGR